MCHLRVASRRPDPNQDCCHHGSHESPVHPSLRRSRASGPQGRTEPVKVLGGPHRPKAFETLKVRHHHHLVHQVVRRHHHHHHHRQHHHRHHVHHHHHHRVYIIIIIIIIIFFCFILIIIIVIIIVIIIIIFFSFFSSSSLSSSSLSSSSPSSSSSFSLSPPLASLHLSHHHDHDPACRQSHDHADVQDTSSRTNKREIRRKGRAKQGLLNL